VKLTALGEKVVATVGVSVFLIVLALLGHIEGMP